MKKAFLVVMSALTVSCVKVNQIEKAVPAVSLLQTSSAFDPYAKFNKALRLNVGGRLFEAMRNTGNDFLTFKEFSDVVKKWYYDHGTPIKPENEKDIKAVWDQMNKDGSVSLSKREILSFLFQYMDSNKDGLWSIDEIMSFIEQQADFAHRVLNDTWKLDLKKRYDELNFGISAGELEKVFKDDKDKDGKPKKPPTYKCDKDGNCTVADCTPGKDPGCSGGDTFPGGFVIPNSKPKPRGLIDPFELAENTYKAMEKEPSKELNMDKWLGVYKQYLEKRNHPWNAETRKQAESIFRKADTSGSGTIDKKELFVVIFDIFDRDGDHRLRHDEMKELFQWYSKFLGRTLRAGWWDTKVLPVVKEIEDGISPQELQAYLEKKNGRITDFRHLVIAVSTPLKGGTKGEGAGDSSYWNW